MRVITWNLAANTVSRSAATHERAWRYLEALDPDLALLQEARPVAWLPSRGDWTVHHGAIGSIRGWGSMILAKAPLRLAAFDGPAEGALEREGLLATGVLTLPDGTSLVVGSVHAPIGLATADELGMRDPEGVRTPGRRAPHRRDVAYAIYRDRTAGRRFLVGGDWNSARLWDETHPGAHESDFFARAEADGWVDCYGRFHPEGEGRTWFRAGDAPYQMDHVFCDPATAERLTSCENHSHPAETLLISDHAPMVLELRSESGGNWILGLSTGPGGGISLRGW